MSRRSAVRLLVGIAIVASAHVATPAAQRPASANPLMPFVSGWNIFDGDVQTDESEPTGSLHQVIAGENIFAWDRPMSVYPQMLKFDEVTNGVKVGVSLPTPQGKAVGALWWCDDPRLNSRREHLDRKKPFDGPLKDLKWNQADPKDIEGCEWRFIHMPRSTGVNKVRVIGLIVDAKEVTRYLFGKWFPWEVKIGSYRDQLRGAEVRYIARSPYVPGTKNYETCILGRDGKLNAKRVCQTLMKVGSGGTPIPLNWENEPGPESGLFAYGRPSNSTVPPREGPLGVEGQDRFAAFRVTTNDRAWVKILWPDGTYTEDTPVDNNGIKVAVPNEFRTFQVYVSAHGKPWVLVRPTWNDGFKRDYYPAPEPGRNLEIDLTPPSK